MCPLTIQAVHKLKFWFREKKTLYWWIQLRGINVRLFQSVSLFIRALLQSFFSFISFTAQEIGKWIKELESVIWKVLCVVIVECLHFPGNCLKSSSVRPDIFCGLKFKPLFWKETSHSPHWSFCHCLFIYLLFMNFIILFFFCGGVFLFLKW